LDHLTDNVVETAQFIKKNFTPKADIAVILGSGLGGAVAQMEPEAELAYEDISHFPVSGVSGHQGKLLLLRVGEKIILVLQGRFHYYEGYTMRGVTFPIRVLSCLNVGSVILTNAAGGLNRRYKPGEFMLIKDHLNLMGDNPLIGAVDEERGAPFVDMRDAYDPELLDLGMETARRLSIPMHQGVLAAVSGPSYETVAEARFLSRAGADAVTMSTVPETIVARHCGMKVLALSCITNSLWQQDRIGHTEVIDVGQAAAEVLAPWLHEMLRKM
jgi:purine-nucleoside phosphorylase